MQLKKNKMLCHASFCGDYNMCKHLIIDRGYDVNMTEKRKTPLLWAIFSPHDTSEICELLISRGARFDERIEGYDTPLQIAVDWGRLDICKVLLRNNANPNPFRVGDSPLHVASAHGNLEMCKLLIRCGADLKAIDFSRKTPAQVADESVKYFMTKASSFKNKKRLYEFCATYGKEPRGFDEEEPFPVRRRHFSHIVDW